MTTTPTSGAADLPEALRSIQRFEVVDCIDSEHVPAVIPKPHGPWVRYEDHAAELRRLHAENESLLTERERNLDSIRVNNEIINKKNAELETLRAKLKVYEDLGDAGSDVQLLRMGYAAARLEIESLKAQLHAAKQINAAQFGLLAASIPGSALPGK